MALEDKADYGNCADIPGETVHLPDAVAGVQGRVAVW